MKYLNYFLIAFLFFLTGNLLAQNKNEAESQYNLPPGTVLKQKILLVDLSYKLTGEVSYQEYSESDLNVIKELSKEEFENLKNIDIEYYNYYTKGLSFFKGLSDKVKKVYSEKELWYIYVFDLKLKEKLEMIK